MQKEKFISGMNGHIVLSPRERERIIQRSVEREGKERFRKNLLYLFSGLP